MDLDGLGWDLLLMKTHSKILRHELRRGDVMHGDFMAEENLGDVLKMRTQVVALVIPIWVNYSDLTATSLESWLIREIMPKWP